MDYRAFVGRDVYVKFKNPDHDWTDWIFLATATINGERWFWLQGRGVGEAGYLGGPESVSEHEIDGMWLDGRDE